MSSTSKRYPAPPALGRLLTFALIVISAAGASARAAGPVVLSEAEWREDLKTLSETVAAKHRHAFDKISKEAWTAAVEELNAQIPTLADHEIIVGMARLVALLRDGHSRLAFPQGSSQAIMPGHTPTAASHAGLFFHSLPVRFYLFSDGLFVESVAAGHERLLGARVVRIGDRTAEEALSAIAPIVSHDSEMWLKMWGPVSLAVPEILHAQRVIPDPALVVLRLAGPDGAEFEATLAAIDSDQQLQWTQASDAAPGPKPLYLRHQDEFFWTEYLVSERLLYCQINQIRDKDGLSLAQLGADLARRARTDPVDKLVLDLRLCGGGNNYLNRGLVLALLRSKEINRYGAFFAVTGRATFSAAISLVSDLERWTDVILVGEPTGNSPSQYGDARKSVLPHSGLTLRLSSVYWRDWSVDESRPYVAPQIPVEVKSIDDFENRDPILERILSYQPPASLTDRLDEIIQSAGLDAAATAYYKYVNDPETAGQDTEPVYLTLARRMEGRGRAGDALQLYQQCTREYPGSFEAHLGQGRLLVAEGERAKALESLSRAEEIQPGRPEVKEWTAKAEALR